MESPGVILDRQILAEMIVLIEEGLVHPLERCIKLYVQIVEKNAKFLSDQKREGQFTAKSVMLNIDLRGFRINKMVDYKIIKYCRLCRKRFVVNKGESKKNYCDDCQLKIDKEQNN